MLNIITKKLEFSKVENLDIKATLSHNIVRLSPNKESSKSASPRLLNWVEPTIIRGYTKTAFYTEVDSNFKKGDRVFIINGNYDSNELINIDKYKKGRDGYKILDIDNCRIVLDIDYTGELPWIEDSIDNFIKVFYVRNQREFDYINSQFISRDGSYSNKFELGQNNFIYVDSPYNGITSGLNQNSGVSFPSFYYRNGTTWIPITNDLLQNTLYFQSLLSINFQNNGRIKVVNSGFSLPFSNKEWRESNVYKFDVNKNEWVVDVKYMRPIITKSNFRRGNFKGNWNKGVYGSYDEKIKWKGDESNWNNGTAINTEWVKGTINSNYTPEVSYFAEFDQFGIPFQKVNISNNRGYGYNYFINTDIKSSLINNGNYIDCNIGITSSTFSAVEGYYQGWNSLMQNIVNLGEFTSCNFESTLIRNSVIKYSRLNNSHIELSKSINSRFKDCVFYKSNYDSDNIIKILDYDEWNVNIDPFSSTNGYKIYKFYINDSQLEKVKSLDKFTIKGLKISKDDYHSIRYDRILNFFDRVFIMDKYKDADNVSISSFDGSTQIHRDIICKVSTSEENKYKLSSYYSGSYSTVFTYSNDKIMSSIDVIVKIDPTFGNHDYNTTFPITATLSKSDNNVDISDAYIIDSYFDSGLFEQSNWNSGYLYNYNLDNRIFGFFNNGQLLLSFTNSQLTVQVLDNFSKGIKDNYFSLGDIVYLNGVDYNNGYTVTRLPNIYKISAINPAPSPNISLELTELLIGTATSIISSLTSSGVFITSPDGLTSSTVGTNRYNYLHKVFINNSNIKSGIIRNGYISNSNIYYEKFNNSDYKFEDKVKLKELVLINSIFSDNKNNIKSGLFIESYINGDGENWYNGILWKSIWENGTFNNGVVKDSNWINGTFKNGMFYNSKTSHFVNTDKAYYKSGNIQSILFNNIRNVWENGIFENGDFFDSIWENGIFKNGRFYKSNWLGGVFENGVFGSVKFNVTDNNFYAGTFSNGVAINSNFYSGFTQLDSTIGPIAYPSSFNGIHWLNGVFQSGVFRNDVENPSAIAVWYNGTFNGGDFTNTSIWMNGTFNDGKFTSYYGCTAVISNTQSDYGWRNGIFNGGEFGNMDGITNSTWWTGEMYGGVFRGKIWNSGILISGEFQGSASQSCVGGISASNASLFVDGFSQSYYGLWRNGFVTDIKDKFIKNKEIFTQVSRSIEEMKFSDKINKNKAVIKNALWMSGTFSHRNGEANNVVWLDGIFEMGNFKNSSFNPYVKRNGSNERSFNLNDNSCRWLDGTFDGGDFYISIWEKGNFIIGTAHGMIWKNGISNYMNAFNICWENGTWRNGNWYGSPYTLDGQITDDYTKQILFRLMNKCTGTSSCHIWNIFEYLDEEENIIISATANFNPICDNDLYSNKLNFKYYDIQINLFDG
jgi:hypothetical protein